MTAAVLVVRFGALGDVILTTPLLRAIARAHPGAAVTFVTKEAYARVVRPHPHVAEVVTLGPGERIASLAARLRRPWDARLDLHGNLRSILLRGRLGGRWDGWRKQRARRALLLRLGVDTFRPPVPVAERYFGAARRLGVAPDGEPAQVQLTDDDRAAAAAIAGAGPYTALCPGAQHWNKRWPASHWEDLARRLLRQGLAVVGIGTAPERAALDLPGVADGFGTDIGVAAALLAGARAAATNDSGLMHLATAVRTPVVALFGPTSPALGYAPYHARGVVLERRLACRPCSAFGGPHCPMRHHRCMIEITAGDVATALMAYV